MSSRCFERIMTWTIRRYIHWNWNWNLDSALRYETACKLIRRMKPVTILEVGSGNRGISAYVQHSSIGVDLMFSKEVNPGLQKRVIGQGTSLPFANNSIDFVMSVDMCEHVRSEERATVIRELFRIVKPEGRVYVTVPVGGRAEAADCRVDKAYLTKKGRSHPMLKDHVVYGLPSKEEIAHIFDDSASQKRFVANISENTPLFLWEWNMNWFAVEKWIPGMRHFQRLILQPLFPFLKRVRSEENYRLVMMAEKAMNRVS